jgi:hypothetical protein
MVKSFVSFMISLFLALPAFAQDKPVAVEPTVGITGVAIFFAACAAFIVWFVFATVKASKKAAEEKK